MSRLGSTAMLANFFKPSPHAHAPQPDAPSPVVDSAQTDAATLALFQDAPFHRIPMFQGKFVTAERRASGAQAPRATIELAPRGELPQNSPVVAGQGVKTANDFVDRLAPMFSPGLGQEHQGRRFVRQEALEVLEGKLKAARPALLADFRRKQRTVLKKAKSSVQGRR
jgi:hypothetical protein